MRLFTLSIVFLLSVGCFAVFAQGSISQKRNAYRPGDRIVKQQVEYIDPGRSGKQITWDFSRLNTVNEKYKLVYYLPNKEDSTRIIGMEHQTRYRYELKHDTLWMTGYTNRLTEMTFDSAEAQLRYPFRYGDSLRTVFSGKGLYCQKVDLNARGETLVSVDAQGMLITPENDTLKNVLRVYRLRNYTEIGEDSARMKLETYSWYALGYRYPVFETVKSWIIKGDSTLEDFGTSFYFPIRNLAELAEDPINEAIRKNEANTNNVLLRCSTWPNPVENDVTVNYELSQDARVFFRLCDVAGRSWVSLPEKALSAGAQQEMIPMSGLPSGDYALYIAVDGYVHRVKVIKR